MNKVTLVGNVVNDLELKDYKKDEKEGKYVRFTLAVNEYNVKRNERIATFVEVVAFDKKAIILAHNVGKGSRLAVEGKIRSSNYLTEAGEKRSKVEKERKDKDPIMFGNIFEDGKPSKKMYVIGDWVDDFCDLTLDKMLQQLAEKKDINKEDVLNKVTDFSDLDDIEKALFGSSSSKRKK